MFVLLCLGLLLISFDGSVVYGGVADTMFPAGFARFYCRLVVSLDCFVDFMVVCFGIVCFLLASNVFILHAFGGMFYWLICYWCYV